MPLGLESLLSYLYLLDIGFEEADWHTLLSNLNAVAPPTGSGAAGRRMLDPRHCAHVGHAKLNDEAPAVNP
jgi:hypothetical protein